MDENPWILGVFRFPRSPWDKAQNSLEPSPKKGTDRIFQTLSDGMSIGYDELDGMSYDFFLAQMPMLSY